jgi:hypothetical protein
MVAASSFLGRPLRHLLCATGRPVPVSPGFSLSRQHVIVAELPLGPMSHSGAASGRQLLKPRVVRTHPGLGKAGLMSLGTAGPKSLSRSFGPVFIQRH